MLIQGKHVVFNFFKRYKVQYLMLKHDMTVVFHTVEYIDMQYELCNYQPTFCFRSMILF